MVGDIVIKYVYLSFVIGFLIVLQYLKDIIHQEDIIL